MLLRASNVIDHQHSLQLKCESEFLLTSVSATSPTNEAQPRRMGKSGKSKTSEMREYAGKRWRRQIRQGRATIVLILGIGRRLPGSRDYVMRSFFALRKRRCTDST